jgi:tellurite resistance protein TerA
MKERALIIAELYKRNGAWKIRAIGQGFSGGLEPLATSFGVDIASPPKQMPPVPEPASNVRLSKISLDKKGDSYTISLKKEDASREIEINLNWTSHPDGAQESGLLGKMFGRKSQEIDLDLGCYLELHDDFKTCIDGLQFAQDGGPRNQSTRQGCYTSSPWIWHMGDDRTGGQSTAGETILVNPQGFKDIKRIIIYAYIYKGVARWGETNAVATVSVPNHPDIIVEMGNQNNKKTFCSLATIDFFDSNQIRVTRNVTFHTGHDECNDAYDWGMSFRAGSK